MRQATRNGIRVAVATLALVIVASGCSAATEKRNGPPKPTITQGLEKDSYAVGERFRVKGKHFLLANGRTKLHFKGEFRARDGTTSPVDVRAPLAVEPGETGDNQIGMWLRFGPFQNPFTDKPKVGRFVGTITPVNEYALQNGETNEVRGEGRSVEVRVEPSIEFVELQPKGAECGDPAIRGLAGGEYRVKVRAIGFTPRTFEWRVAGLKSEDSIGDYKIFKHRATGPTDTLGDDPNENITFKGVPRGTKYYEAVIQVRAKDQATGKYVHTSLPFGIHRAVEVESVGDFEVAEYYRPEPVTACIRGTVGNTATYSETETEVRQRSVSVGISESFTRSQMASQSVNWMKGYGVSASSSTTKSKSQTRSRTETTARTESQEYNESRSNSFNYGTEKGESWRVGNEAGVKVGAEASGSIPLVAEGTVSTETHYNRSWGRSGSTSKSKEWGETVTQGKSHSFSKSYTLSDSVSSSRSISNTEARSESRTYNFGASATRSRRIAQGITTAEEQTWMKSKSSSTLTSYSGFIPVDHFGVFYRQTIRMVRRARIQAFNACGEVKDMGEIHLNTWNWAPALATSENCGNGDFPQPDLPEAQCLVEPCD